MKSKKPYFLLLILLMFFGCQIFQDNDNTIIAQVDKNKLKLSDINSAIGHSPDPQLKSDFIDQWVEKQLWLKEAKRYIKPNESMKEKVQEYENLLLIDTYQQKFILENISITESDVRDYYKSNKDKFLSFTDAAYIQIYTLDDIENAEDLLENLKNAIQPNIHSEFKLLYKNEFIPEIDKLLFSSKSGKYIGPVNTNGHFYVIVVIEKYSKDSILAMEHVRMDIIQKLRAMAFVKEIDKKQNELKDQYNVKIIKNTDN